MQNNCAFIGYCYFQKFAKFLELAKPQITVHHTLKNLYLDWISGFVSYRKLFHMFRESTLDKMEAVKMDIQVGENK